MYNVAFITPNNPYESYGGAIMSDAIYNALIEFISPKGEVVLLTKKAYNSVNHFGNNIYTFKKSVLEDSLSRIVIGGNFLYLYKNKIKSIIKNSNVIIFQNTRLGKLSQYLKLIFPEKYFITFVDNVELPIFDIYMKNKKDILRPFVMLERVNVKACENSAFQSSDRLVFLKKSDLKIAESLYNVKLDHKSTVIPFTFRNDPVKNIKNLIKFYHRKVPDLINGRIRFLFTGNFYYYPNFDGAKWLIEIFDKLTTEIYRNQPWIKDIFLIIAGKGADALSSVRDKASEKVRNKIKFYVNPDLNTMYSLFTNSHIYICPVFVGGGLKAKIMEALMYGLPIVSSVHSIEGYESFVKECKSSILIFENFDDIDFAKKIIKILNFISSKKNFLHAVMCSRRIYENYLSYEVFKSKISKLFSEIR